MICLIKNPTRLFLASAFLIALEPDLTFRPMQLFKSCPTSRHTTMMSSCATAVPSFGLQVTTVMDCGPMMWYRKLALLPDVLLEVRHPHRHLRLCIQLITQQAQAHLSEGYLHPRTLLPRALSALALQNHPPSFPPRAPSLQTQIV